MMQADAEATRICPDCGTVVSAAEPQCIACGTCVPVVGGADVEVFDSRFVRAERIYIAISSCWILLCLVDVVRYLLDLVNSGLGLSTPTSLLAAAALHGAIGLLSLLHEESSMAFASYLCFLQASIALFGFALAYFSSRGSAFIAAETYFIFLGCLAIAQLAVLRDKAFG